MMCTSKVSDTFFSILGSPNIPDVGDAVGIASALCPSPCPVRQIAWWSRAVGSRGSLPRHSQVPSATSAGCVPALESDSFHPRTKPLHFPVDSSTTLQYPVLSLQKMDPSRA